MEGAAAGVVGAAKGGGGGGSSRRDEIIMQQAVEMGVAARSRRDGWSNKRWRCSGQYPCSITAAREKMAEAAVPREIHLFKYLGI